MAADQVPYTVRRRQVKYPRLEFKTGRLEVILPRGHDPEMLLKKHEDWVAEKAEFVERCLKESHSKELVHRTDEEFRNLVNPLAEEIAERLGVQVSKVYVRKMKTKWASCSHRRSLTLNRLMKYLPDHLVRYVIFHEVAHILEKKHHHRFWNIISEEFSDYRRLERDLFVYWLRVALAH